jgi:hypothetical protein
LKFASSEIILETLTPEFAKKSEGMHTLGMQLLVPGACYKSGLGFYPKESYGSNSRCYETKRFKKSRQVP